MKIESNVNAQLVDELRSEEYARYLENHNAPQMRLPKNLKEVEFLNSRSKYSTAESTLERKKKRNATNRNWKMQ
jgi:hypothetical protein